MARANFYIGMTLVAAFSLSAFAADDGTDPAADKKADKKANKIGKPPKEDRKAMDRNAPGEAQWDRGLDFINEHAKDLNLTPDQITKLADLKKSITEKFAKLKDDPDMRDLFTQMYEARQNEDKEHMQELRRKIRDALEKKGISAENAMGEIGKILNRDQLMKLAELRKKNGMEANPMKKMREEKAEEAKDAQRDRPDPDKGTPSLFDEK